MWEWMAIERWMKFSAPSWTKSKIMSENKRRP
jgi:hypothetical protein